MATKGGLTREQAIRWVGRDAVDAVAREICEPTNRVGYNGSCQGDDLTEWSASVACTNIHGDNVTLIMYYYTTADDEAYAAKTDDWGGIDWDERAAGYEIA